MSEVKLNLIDSKQVLHGTIHGAMADRCVAALSAEPETIAELDAALRRYVKSLDTRSNFGSFRSRDYGLNRCPELDTEPWDAGIVVIDLAARIVASESSYSQPGPDGQVSYHDGHSETEISVLYRVPENWLFVNSIDAYQWSRERRLRERAANPTCDARPVLFGRPLLEFIVDAYRSLPTEIRELFSQDHLAAEEDEAMQAALQKEISAIHARWLLTPRADLRNQSPREVLLAKQDFIDFDLHTRSLQWSLQNEGPPCLAVDSFAYRFAGFGTHEWVIYYDLVRLMISSLVSRGPGSRQLQEEIARLEQIKTAWLESPQPDFDGHVPAILIDNERKRLPQAMHAHDMIIDDDCPICQAFGDESSPLGMGVGFWHLDGSEMDDDFAFSHYQTREEWDAANQRHEEFNREFNRKWQERQEQIARGETPDPDPFFDPEPIGDGWGWFDPLAFPDSIEPDAVAARDAPSGKSDDSDTSDLN
ncbi:MAG TPA: hypothetical protein VGO68_22420 [Pyrinomonadaceae bacterium]|jgi:hypothetical protein|nr:hypothetical protein [Pyrinomonadaceae bacterium]